MALPKLFNLITWHNNASPAINEDNLNAMSSAIDDIDDRVISLAGTIMEDVPQIQEDLAILEPAIESIDSNVERAETAAENAEDSAESAEEWANIANPPIVVTKDFASIISIDDAIPKAARDVKLKVEPVQDLHGYTKPWVGGAGKNKLPTTLAILKEANTAGTWVDNVYTYQGVTFTVNIDDGGNVTGISTSGTSSAAFSFRLKSDNTLSFTEETILSGCPSGGGSSTYALVKEPYSDVGSGVNIPANSAGYMYIRVQAASVNMSGKVFKPMIRLASVSDATFEPYTNICPITGWTGANLYRTNGNIFNPSSTIVQNNAYGFFKVWDNDVPMIATLVDKKPSVTLTGMSFGFSYALTSGGVQQEISQGFVWILANGALTDNRKNYDSTHQKYCGQFVFYPNTQEALNTILDKYDIQVELGETATEYKPYEGTLYTIDLDGTRYGGTLDVTSGVLTLDRVGVDLDTLTFSTYNEANRIYYSPALDTNSTDAIFEQYFTQSPPPTASNWPDGCAIIESSNHRIYARDTRHASVTDYNNANKGKVVYKLATPTTVQLTPTEVELLQGENVLSGDTGDIYLEYDASMIQRIANSKLDIDIFKSVVAASSDFANFKTRVAAL